MAYRVSLIDSDTNGRRRLYRGEDGEIWYTDDTLTLAYVDAVITSLQEFDEGVEENRFGPEEMDETLGGRVDNKETDVIYRE